MKRCAVCDREIDPVKDFFITVNERKGPSRDLCSLICTNKYVKDVLG